MLPRVLLTGFKPFSQVDVNPTERLMNLVSTSADQFPNVLIKTLVLETDYKICEQQFSDTIVSFVPHAILSFGVSFTTDKLKLEQIARNFDNSNLPDNSGNQRSGQKIITEGSLDYRATVPIEKMYKALKDAEVPVRISNDAGSYVCNHLFYYGLHLIETLHLKTIMGFVHVPPFSEQLVGKSLRSGMDIDTLLEATRICVTVLLDRLDSP